MNNLSPSDKPEQTEAAEEKKTKPDDKLKQKSKQDEAAEKTSVSSNNNESGNCYWWLSVINLAGDIFATLWFTIERVFAVARREIWILWNYFALAAPAGFTSPALDINWANWYRSWWIMYLCARIVRRLDWKVLRKTRRVSIVVAWVYTMRFIVELAVNYEMVAFQHFLRCAWQQSRTYCRCAKRRMSRRPFSTRTRTSYHSSTAIGRAWLQCLAEPLNPGTLRYLIKALLLRWITTDVTIQHCANYLIFYIIKMAMMIANFKWFCNCRWQHDRHFWFLLDSQSIA